MDYNTFETYLSSLNTYKNEGRKFIDDYKILLPIESNLYGINVTDYIAKNEAQYTKEDNIYDEDDEVIFEREYYKNHFLQKIINEEFIIKNCIPVEIPPIYILKFIIN